MSINGNIYISRETRRAYTVHHAPSFVQDYYVGGQLFLYNLSVEVIMNCCFTIHCASMHFSKCCTNKIYF